MGGLGINRVVANECGLQKSKSHLLDRQNIYDETIYQTALHYHLPPRIIKGIFSRESQFTPEATTYEFRLGHITDNGADTLLMYDPKIFESIAAEH